MKMFRKILSAGMGLFMIGMIQSCGDKVKMIEPVTELGAEGENVKGLYYYPGMQVYLKSPDFFENRLAEVAEAGFKYIEIKLKYASIKYDEMTDEEITALFSDVRRQIEEKGVKVWSIHLPYGNGTWTDLGGEEDIRLQSVDFMLRILRLCTENFPECKTYVIHPSHDVLEPRSRTIEQSRKSLETMLPVAKSYSVRLCLENMVKSLCNVTEEKEAVISGFNDLRTTYDIGHANCSVSEKDVVEFLEWEGTNLGTVHIHDNIRGTVKDEHRLAGDGDISKWGEVYKTLLTVNRYRGVFMFEPKDNQSAADVMASYQMILDAYNNL